MLKQKYMNESLNSDIKLLDSNLFTSFFDPRSLVQKLDFTWQPSNIVCIFPRSLESKFSLALRTDWIFGTFFMRVSKIDIFLNRNSCPT